MRYTPAKTAFLVRGESPLTTPQCSLRHSFQQSVIFSTKNVHIPNYSVNWLNCQSDLNFVYKIVMNFIQIMAYGTHKAYITYEAKRKNFEQSARGA